MGYIEIYKWLEGWQLNWGNNDWEKFLENGVYESRYLTLMKGYVNCRFIGEFQEEHEPLMHIIADLRSENDRQHLIQQIYLACLLTG